MAITRKTIEVPDSPGEYHIPGVHNMQPTLRPVDIMLGHAYRAKKPANIGDLVNDRVVLYEDILVVQYDGPAVGWGRHYPKVSREAFAKWAGRDVTDDLPAGEWAQWESGIK